MTRRAASGTVLALAGALLAWPASAAATTEVGAGSPTLAAWREGALLVWQEGAIHLLHRETRILARRLDQHGQPVGNPLVIAQGATHSRPRAACLQDGRCLVAWQTIPDDGRDWDVLAARVDARKGAVLDPGGVPLDAGPRNQALPAVAAAGHRFAIVWQDMATDGFYELRLAILHAEMKPSESRVRALTYSGRQARRWLGYTPGWGWGRRPIHPGRARSPRVLGGEPHIAAVDGTRWLIDWMDQTNWRPGHNVWVRLAVVHATGMAPPRIVSITEPPDPHSGQAPGVVIVASENVAMHGTALVTGRGGTTRVALGRLLDPARLEWLRPAQEDQGWRPARRWPGVFRLFGGTPVEGPLAGTRLGNKFVWLARAPRGRRDRTPTRLILSALDREGRRLGTRTVHESRGAVEDPAMAAVGEGLLVAFREDPDGSGRWLLRWLRIAKEALP